ncbi:alanine-tRNA ligase [Verruconis gallopava]|uniref:Alanine--tRNA ligase n=1 Tax=Verruconis gallopava TaxID=253628 RepID=A0A0D2ANU8_9PEZI|nr:alanine-tRNA ligase [Verruconis gallopava]KIW00804.1 alanine-tRNA ligase [Verruconis gallopava]
MSHLLQRKSINTFRHAAGQFTSSPFRFTSHNFQFPFARCAYATMAVKQEWTANSVRKQFIDYFEQRGHTYVPSSPVVPLNDPTLLFTNAGMNQFKSIFLGTVDPNSNFAKLKRAVNTQKCIRAGGKHNDLDDVGKDSYHHTYFEMLGNWSFGDYFKKEAIAWSWELLTKVYGLEPDRLYVTYFEGDPSLGLEPDFEARDLWKAVGVAEDHILKGNAKDNFWEMGDQGPCGPCSEVHYDRIGGRNAASLVNQDDPDVLEIWNNVFIQYNREPDKSLRSLPNKHVDTGMGFERLLSILQNKRSNYDTDVFMPLFARIQELTGARPYSGKFGKDDSDGIDTAYRVLADHVRMTVIAISDGGFPENVGRGYVVRRVLRRAVRYARRYFKIEPGKFLGQIAETLIAQIGHIFPAVQEKQDEIIRTLNEEELAFGKTLDRGEVMFEKFAKQAEATGSKQLSGANVWLLYESYGFPDDLTQIMADERGLKIDPEEVKAAQERAREASKGQKTAAEATMKLDVHSLGDLEKAGVPRTDDKYKFGREDVRSQIKAIYSNKKFAQTTEGISKDQQVGLLLDKTSFYAEQGGQVGDSGRIVIDGEAELSVVDTQVFNGYVLHIGYMSYGKLSVGDTVICDYDELRRDRIRRNHTGTHTLNLSLREFLGNDVHQKGSLVAAEKLRFDFSHNAPVTDAQLEKIEKWIRNDIAKALPVYAKEVPLAEAREIEGVRAVFGETYPDPVRVVVLGVDVDEVLKDKKNPKWRDISIEFCGGTHTATTKDIDDLVVIEESGIAKGIRRIIAVTGRDAREVKAIADDIDEQISRLEKLNHGEERDVQFKSITETLNKANISALSKSKFKARLGLVGKAIVDAQKAATKEENKKVLDQITRFFKESPDKRTYIAKLEGLSPGSKAISEALKHTSTKMKDKAVYLFANDVATGKIMHGASVGDLLQKEKLLATEWTAVVSKVIGGKAGGKPAMSVGSGVHADKLDDGIEEARKYLEDLKI